jgi:hypothetical protein
MIHSGNDRLIIVDRNMIDDRLITHKWYIFERNMKDRWFTIVYRKNIHKWYTDERLMNDRG